jgi:hypothetical protein
MGLSRTECTLAQSRSARRHPKVQSHRHGYVSYHPGMADPKKYRDEAERLRNEAAETNDGETRETMLNIAKLYDRLAQTLAKQRGKPKSS